ncbi:LuxR C-terminal-related transcriptional regulator [Rhodococcus sp. USK13]|uniref:LuxR C-terminal-related transcriptional regulator n=1 Tax=Rhodococcus sp. USK13 TaxID=2806442 RepID=UPI001BCB2967|nr:LuxR C-terminal-related transcriptional regulator [Rhodococcus sp. USK13]
MAVRSGNGPSGVPAELTSFVGRRTEAAEVRTLLSTARLVTLAGVGGVGKTRLALRVASDVRRAFPDGVCLVELAALKDAALLPHTVVNALELLEQSTRPPTTVLADHLRGRQMLLIIDNCEHLLQAVADLAELLLKMAPELKILATSRQALRITGEHIYLVPPLPVPDPRAPHTPGMATGFPAVSLFADRASSAVPGFTISPANEAAVIRLCHRLEGIPLAIELAAVRLRVLDVSDLANRLDSRFELLLSGSRSAPKRHQTLKALIDWSYDLCAVREQELWARAAVFANGFGLSALEAVCADEQIPPETILDTVAELTEKSIFVREEHGGRVRFRMLETIREYGQARLRESGSEPVFRRRHRDWCLQLVEQAATEWFGPLQEDWASVLQDEHANLRGALEYSLTEPGEIGVALRMAGLPWFMWIALGFMTEGRHWIERALQADKTPSHERAWALATCGYITTLQGDTEAQAALLAEAHRLAVELDDDAARAYATHLLGMQGNFSGELAAGIPLFVEALERYAAVNVPQDYPNSLRIPLAITYLLLGELDKGSAVVDELDRLCDVAGERWLLSYAKCVRAFLYLLSGRLTEAESLLLDALRVRRPIHDNFWRAMALDFLGWVTVAKGNSKRAAVILGGADTLWQTIGAPLFGSIQLQARRRQFEATARKAIGDDAFDSAFKRGHGLDGNAAVAFALGEPLRERQRAGAGRSEAEPDPSELTRRQREVAELVTDGLTNGEIASRLFISPRTAEGHVENILTKLGFTSRAQIVNWVAAQRFASINDSR